jgi:hypothetical protein
MTTLGTGMVLRSEGQGELFNEATTNSFADPDPLLRGTDPDSNPDPFIINKETLIFTVL